MSDAKERACWQPVREIMGNQEVLLGQHIAYQFTNTPRRVLYSLSYYKFAAKLIGADRRVLDVGCGEGLGTWLLAVECGQAKGIDIDNDAIKVGSQNWKEPKISFGVRDFFAMEKEQYDAIVIFDVIEHILPKHSDQFFKKITDSLLHNGIAIMGTPNITAQQYASDVTKKGHVNLYSAEKLEKEMKAYFWHTFMFGANDEVVHTGFLPMAHYLIAVGCRKRI